MTEKEALEQSLEHWRDNLVKVKALDIETIKHRFKHWEPMQGIHMIAHKIFGIGVGDEDCALCRFHHCVCDKCVLHDSPDKNGMSCCAEWRQVSVSLILMMYGINELSVVKLITAVNGMVRRLEYELEGLL